MANQTLLMNVDIGETRVGLIANGVLQELYIERQRHRSPVGNIYLGRVSKVLPGMQAAFIDLGLERAAFLHVEDLLAESTGDEDNDNVNLKSGEHGRHKRVSRKTPIRDLLQEGQSLMVQVSKGPIGTKGARVTGHVSLPGRYVVFMPTMDRVGVSKRIGSDKERRRLKEVIESIKPPQGGVVVRTLAQGLTKKKLKADIGYLVQLWEQARADRETVKKAPALIYEEPDIIIRATRDLFTEEVDEIVIDDENEYLRLKNFLTAFVPERTNNLRLYSDREPLFDEYGVEEEIIRALSRKVQLPSGGHLVIDQAEALTAIDVNTGRFTGKGQDVEQTILQTNLEAVREIAYQLRFRNIGGLIVLDFIDMERYAHREKVFKALLASFKQDKSKTTVIRISEFGLVEMTRKRTRQSLHRTLYEPCFFCDGTGQLQSKETVCHEILRQMQRERDALPGYKIIINAHPAICDMLNREQKCSLDEAARRFQRKIELNPRNDYHLEQFNLTAD